MKIGDKSIGCRAPENPPIFILSGFGYAPCMTANTYEILATFPGRISYNIPLNENSASKRRI
jgi:hypothetical protein